MLVKSKIKYIQSLSQKQLRDEQDVFVAEGPKLVEELIHAPNVNIAEVFATTPWILHHRLLNLTVEEVSEEMLARISSLKTPNQVLAVCTKPRFASPIIVTQHIVLLLDGIQDPGNLGTIIRCADWFGVEGVVCSHTCADLFSSKVVQASMGSITRVQVLYTDLETFIRQHPGVSVMAATLDGKDITKSIPVQEGMLLIGNESKGISESLLSLAKHKFKIPGNGNAESLNAAVATGILLAFLFHAKTQR